VILLFLSYFKNMGFKENLKAELSYADMRVKELASLSEVKKSTIDSYLRENGYSPSAEVAVRIAQALGVSVEYLVTGSELPQKKSYSSLRPEMRSLIQSIAHLTEANRKIVLENALSLAEMLKKRK
jgi:transcriptional regulator with XRE-family HTH domain